MASYMLETKNLTKNFRKQKAVNKVSMHIRNNTIYGLLGPNGAGKSTVLKLIMGIFRPSEGEILFKGQPWNRANLKQIGALIESPALYGNLTAYENLLIHTKLLQLPETRIKEVLEIVELTDTNKKRVSQFSYGMKQRLGIAKALLNDPPMLILDEPTNGLDPHGIRSMRELIKGFKREGKTIIISSHILSEIEQIVDDIGIIQEGKLKYESKMTNQSNLEQLYLTIVQEERVVVP